MLAEMKGLRDQKVGEWEVVLKQAKMMTAEYQNNIDGIGKELVARAKEMHNQVDNILSTSQKILQQIKASGLAKLQQQEKYLEDKLHQMKEDVEKYENQLRDPNSNVLLQFKQYPDQSKDKTKPPALEAELPLFTKGLIDTDAMHNMFGKLSTGTVPHPSNPKPPISDTRKTKMPPSGGASSSSGTRTLIPNPSIQHEFKVGFDIPYIACVEGGQAWVKTGERKLQLMDWNGSVRDTINADSYISNIAVTSDDNLLLADCWGYSIKSLSRQQTLCTLFRTKWWPHSLCCLNNGDIVVRFGNDARMTNSKVLIYSRTGQIRQTLDHIKFKVIKEISVNKVNQDIYICDKEHSSLGSPGKVITVGSDYKLRYEYKGQGDRTFTPEGMCTDKMGHVLITDYYNHRVHILDQGGQFIQYILNEEHEPITIDVNSEGYVWVGNWVYNKERCVKVARYLQ